MNLKSTMLHVVSLAQYATSCTGSRAVNCQVAKEVEV